MGRHKAAKHCKILPWLSAKADCAEGRFIQVGNSLMLSKRFHDLNPGARWLYLSMANESGGKREMTFTHGTAKKYGISGTSFDRYAKELCEKGFIERVPDPNMERYAPRIFRFSFAWESAESAPHFGEG